MTTEQAIWMVAPALLAAALVTIAVALRPIIGSLREQFTGCRGGRRLKHYGRGNVSQGEEVPDE